VAELQTIIGQAKLMERKKINFPLVYYVCCLAAVTRKIEDAQTYFSCYQILVTKNLENNKAACF
jgi:hypothetical protein